MAFFSSYSLGLRLALKAHFLLMSLGFLCFVLLAAMLAAQFSGRQPASVALDIGLSAIRLSLPLVMVFVVQELISREFERRYYLSSLSFPCKRTRFLLSRFCSVMALCLVTLLLWSIMLAVMVWVLSQGYEQASPVALGFHYLITVFFVGLDLVVLTALATFIAVVASTPSFVLIGTLGFMLLARSFSAVIELLANNSYVVSAAEQYRAGVGFLRYLLPDLGAFDVRMVTLYGHMDFLPQDWFSLILSGLGYSLGLLALAAWSLNFKRFA